MCSGCTSTPMKGWSGSARPSLAPARSRRRSTRPLRHCCSASPHCKSTGMPGRCRTSISASAAPAWRCAPRQPSTSRCGTCSARRSDSRFINAWAASRTTRSASTIPAPAIATSARAAGQKTDNWGLNRLPRAGRTRTSTPSCNRADELAHSLLEQGFTAMKIWPFDFAAEATEGRIDIPGRTRQGSRPVPQDPRCGRQQDGHHGRTALAVDSAGSRGGVARPASHLRRSGSKTRSR